MRFIQLLLTISSGVNKLRYSFSESQFLNLSLFLDKLFLFFLANFDLSFLFLVLSWNGFTYFYIWKIRITLGFWYRLIVWPNAISDFMIVIIVVLKALELWLKLIINCCFIVIFSLMLIYILIKSNMLVWLLIFWARNPSISLWPKNEIRVLVWCFYKLLFWGLSTMFQLAVCYLTLKKRVVMILCIFLYVMLGGTWNITGLAFVLLL